MSTTHEVIEPRSATTGESVSIVAHRNRVGLWMLIAIDAAGSVSALVTYVYLWSLNVNSAWAPPKNHFAPSGPFWLITLGAVVGAALLWWGWQLLRSRGRAASSMAALAALVVYIVTLVGQIVQLSTFPFGPQDGAYASATLWLCIFAAFHLALLIFLALGVFVRTRVGVIARDNPSHARLVAMYATWVVVSIFLGALVATAMTVSPNTKSPSFGEFKEPAATSTP